MSLSFTPSPKFLVLEIPDEGAEKSLASGIVLPGTRVEQAVVKGLCVAVGRDVPEAEIYKGRSIMVGRYVGTEVTIDGTTYLFVSPDYVLGFYDEGLES